MKKILPFSDIENACIKLLVVVFLVLTFNNVVSYITEDVYGYSSLSSIPNYFVAFIAISAIYVAILLQLINVYMLYSLFKEIRIKLSKKLVIKKILIYILINYALFYYSTYIIRNFD